MIPLSQDRRGHAAPVAAITLMLVCVMVFLAQCWSVGLDEHLITSFGFIPQNFFGGYSGVSGEPLLTPTVSLLSYMFLHGGWLHLIGNMLFLAVFAGKVEDATGHAGFVLFFVLCGIAAALAQGAVEPGSVKPVIGASGGVSGVLGAYLLLHPRAEITVAIPIFIVVQIVQLPAWIVLIAWFLFQLLYDLFPDPTSASIAFRAHLGGFLAGMVLILLFTPRLRAATTRNR